MIYGDRGIGDGDGESCELNDRASKMTLDLSFTLGKWLDDPCWRTAKSKDYKEDKKGILHNSLR